MKRLLFVLAAAALLAPAALAKGPSAASITGPGLSEALSFGGMDDSSRLTEYAGFFPAVFGQSPSPMLSARPVGKLGPRYRIHYVVPDGSPTPARLVQDLYPYAVGGAVTYMKPGQRIFNGRATGGWYAGGPALKRLLVRAGLPTSAPRAATGASSSNLALFAGIGIPGALALAGAALLVARRRSSS
jgi:LPXTG-motif cell wall-anchored protein